MSTYLANYCIQYMYMYVISDPSHYRLIILSTSGQSKPHRYHGRGASIDLSMWIALNNIMSVDLSYDSMVRVGVYVGGVASETNFISLTALIALLEVCVVYVLLLVLLSAFRSVCCQQLHWFPMIHAVA